jgi:hypothetical protein
VLSFCLLWKLPRQISQVNVVVPVVVAFLKCRKVVDCVPNPHPVGVGAYPDSESVVPLPTVDEVVPPHNWPLPINAIGGVVVSAPCEFHRRLLADLVQS